MKRAGQRSPGDRLGVVIIEDSPIMQRALGAVCAEDPHLEVLGIAGRGAEGVELAERLGADVITLDIGLPDIDGFAVVERVMAERPTPILVLTATLRPVWRKEAFHALTLGAVDVMKKPRAVELRDPEWRRTFRRQLDFVARTTVLRRLSPRLRDGHRRRAAGRTPVEVGLTKDLAVDAAPEVIVVVGSSGGPRAAALLLGGLTEEGPPPVPVVVALHFGAQMEGAYARFLCDTLGIEARPLNARAGLEPGVVYVAPGGKHTELVGKRRVRIFDHLPDSAYAPSLDCLLRSVARVHGASAAGVILSGMGKDGAEGLLALRRCGALTLAQESSSCVVAGMPDAAQRSGAVVRQEGLDEIARSLRRWAERRGGAARVG